MSLPVNFPDPDIYASQYLLLSELQPLQELHTPSSTFKVDQKYNHGF